MVRRHSRRSTFLLALLAALLAMSAAPAVAAPVRWVFGSCDDIRDHILRAPDGKYILSNSDTIFTVYCHDMTGVPREYIDLTRTGTTMNFAQYTAGGAAPGTNVRTSFTRLRIDPATLTVDIGDLTFASSTGSLRHGDQTVTAMPYGVAMSCQRSAGTEGAGNITLQGTPYQVTSTFVTAGYLPGGAAVVSQGNQVVDLTGGGVCGWISPAPAMYNPFNPSPGDFHLKLSCAQTPVVPDQHQFCVNVR